MGNAKCNNKEGEKITAEKPVLIKTNPEGMFTSLKLTTFENRYVKCATGETKKQLDSLVASLKALAAPEADAKSGADAIDGAGAVFGGDAKSGAVSMTRTILLSGPLAILFFF